MTTRKLTIMDIVTEIDNRIDKIKTKVIANDYDKNNRIYELIELKKWIQEKYQKGVEI